MKDMNSAPALALVHRRLLKQYSLFCYIYYADYSL